MKRKTILIVTGTRAEYGLFKSTILRLKKSKRLNVKLLVTGMHTLKQYGSTINEIRKGTQVDCVVPIRPNDRMTAALARETIGIDQYMSKTLVDAILVIGDRDEPFAAATVGIHRNVPVIHVSGGDVSGPTVDHYLRNAISVFSKLHLVQTERSKRNVIRLGADPKFVHVVGSAGLDQLGPKIVLSKKVLARQLNLDEKIDWFLVAQHPTPFDTVPFAKQINAVTGALKKVQGEKIIIYPNADTGSAIFIQAIEKLKRQPGYHLFRNLDHQTFLSTLCHSQAFIGNSSAGLMEAGYLKIPFVLVGNRQDGREAGPNVIRAGYRPERIVSALKKAQSPAFIKKIKKLSSIYRGGEVSGRITHAIEQFLTGR